MREQKTKKSPANELFINEKRNTRNGSKRRKNKHENENENPLPLRERERAFLIYAKHMLCRWKRTHNKN